MSSSVTIDSFTFSAEPAHITQILATATAIIESGNVETLVLQNPAGSLTDYYAVVITPTSKVFAHLEVTEDLTWFKSETLGSTPDELFEEYIVTPNADYDISQSIG